MSYIKSSKLITLSALVVLVVIVVIAIIVGRFWWQDQTVTTVANQTVDRPELNFAFTYPSGETAYSLLEPALASSTLDSGPEAAYILMETKDYIEFQSGNPEGGETPPSLSIFVFAEPAESTTTVASGTPKVDRLTRLRNWAEANRTFTSYHLARNTPEEVKLDGVSALHYLADGVYQQDIYLATNRGRYYLFVGQYDAETDLGFTTFQELVQSVVFY